MSLLLDLLPDYIPSVWGEGILFAPSGLDAGTNWKLNIVATLGELPGGMVFHTQSKFRLCLGQGDAFQIIRAACSDLVWLDTDEDSDDSTVLVWSDANSLRGRVTGGIKTELSLVGGEAKECNGSITLLGDSDSKCVACLIMRGQDISLAFAENGDLAELRARTAMGKDLEELISKRLAFYRNLPRPESVSKPGLFMKCAGVMKVNTMSPEGKFPLTWSTPDRVPHRNMWLWDSVFHSFAMNDLNPDVSFEFLASVLDCMWTEEQAEKAGEPSLAGMIPHMMLPDGQKSRMTQPPILAWGFYENFKVHQEGTKLKSALPLLERYLNWNFQNRSLKDDGLLYWLIEGDPNCRSGESGMDNSPRFDNALEMDAVDFTAFAAHDALCLSRLFGLLGDAEKEEEWRVKSLKSSKALHENLWDEERGFYFDRLPDGTFSDVPAVSGFFPLILPDLPESRLEALVNQLQQPGFNTAFPVPSVSSRHESYGSDMWRGATWINANWLIATGLRRHGKKELAAQLVKATLDEVENAYYSSGCIFEFYDSSGRVPPSRCNRKGPPDGKSYMLGKMNSIRDYHWSAALSYVMLRDIRCDLTE